MPTQGIQERNTGFPASLFPWYSLAKLGPRQDLFTVSPRERRGTKGRRRATTQARAQVHRRSSKSAEMDPSRPVRLFKAPTAEPREGGSAPSRLASRGGRGPRPPPRPLLPSNPSQKPRDPRRNARIPPRCRLLNAAPTDLLLQGRATGIPGRSRIAGGPRFTHPRCFQLPPAFPQTQSPPA